MRLNKVRLFAGDLDADERFLEMIKDSVKRHERLKVLEQNRAMFKWALFVFTGLFFVMVVSSLTSNNAGPSLYPAALDLALMAGMIAQHSAVDAKIKMIKLYVLLTQSSDRAT